MIERREQSSTGRQQDGRPRGAGLGLVAVYAAYSVTKDALPHPWISSQAAIP